MRDLEGGWNITLSTGVRLYHIFQGGLRKARFNLYRTLVCLLVGGLCTSRMDIVLWGVCMVSAYQRITRGPSAQTAGVENREYQVGPGHRHLRISTLSA